MRRLTSEEIRQHITAVLADHQNAREDAREEALAKERQEWVEQRRKPEMAYATQIRGLREEAGEAIRDRVSVAGEKFWEAHGEVPEEERGWILEGCQQLADAARQRILRMGEELGKALEARAPEQFAQRTAATLPSEAAGTQELSCFITGRRLREVEKRRDTPPYLRLWWQGILVVVAVGGLVVGALGLLLRR